MPDANTQQAPKKRDIHPQELPDLALKEQPLESLNQVYDFVVRTLGEAVAYYINQCKWKKFRAIFLRRGAIVFGALAGIIPLVQQIYVSNNYFKTDAGKLYLSQGWSPIFLAIAATLTLIDRFEGNSSAWMRFIKTELKLQKVLSDFQMDWQRNKSQWQGNQPNSDELKLQLQLAKDTLSSASQMIQDETDVWIQEFSSMINKLDSMSEAKKAEDASNKKKEEELEPKQPLSSSSERVSPAPNNPPPPPA